MQKPTIGEIRRGKELGRKSKWGKLIWVACNICGKERWVQLVKGMPVSQRCGACYTRGGKDNPKWRGGRTKTTRGYILVKLFPENPFYPMAHSGYVKEHRLVVAWHLERCLHIWEIVHHKHTKYPAGSIEDKQDNRIENLQLVTDDEHKQITILEERIKYLEHRVALLEARNIIIV